jgi:hypothetical protein
MISEVILRAARDGLIRDDPPLGVATLILASPDGVVVSTEITCEALRGMEAALARPDDAASRRQAHPRLRGERRARTVSAGTVVGIDYDSYKATLCALPLDGSIGDARIAVARFRPASRSGEDAAINGLREVEDSIVCALAELTTTLSTTVVWIERGFGMSRRADFILGAYFGAIFSACWNLAPASPVVNPIEAREWKRIVTAHAGIGLTKKSAGNPNAKKEIANEACRALLTLGEIDGSEWTPDELDSFGVAFAGRALNREALAA